MGLKGESGLVCVRIEEERRCVGRCVLFVCLLQLVENQASFPLFD